MIHFPCNPETDNQNELSRGPVTMRTKSGWIILGLLGLAISASQVWSRGGRSPESLKVVVHVNFAESGRQGHGLRNVSNILKQESDSQVVVVCHSEGITLAEKARSEHGELIATLMGQGVTFLACENTMRRIGLNKEDLLPGFGTTASGAWEVVRRQQREGFAYFKP
jgi:hypothetical protein